VNVLLFFPTRQKTRSHALFSKGGTGGKGGPDPHALLACSASLNARNGCVGGGGAGSGMCVRDDEILDRSKHGGTRRDLHCQTITEAHLEGEQGCASL
jgi:hypothetical protein